MNWDGSGTIDCLHSLGKKPSVGVSVCFRPGLKVDVYDHRPYGPVEGSWDSMFLFRGTLTVKAIEKDILGRATGRIEFVEPLPKGTRKDDFLVFSEAAA